MKQGRTLAEVMQQVEKEAKAKRDLIVPAQSIFMGDEADWIGIYNKNSTERFAPNTLFHHQMASALNIPTKFYDYLAQTHPELLVSTVNTLVYDRKVNYMVRTMDYGSGMPTARAFLSERYRRVDNLEIATATLPLFAGLPDVEVVSTEVTESRLHIKIVNHRLEAEVKNGDIVQAGVVISNSEVGLGAVSVRPLLYRLVCTNGMILNSLGERRHHVGRQQKAIEDCDYTVYSDETMEAEDKAFLLKLRDATTAAIEESRFHTAVDQLKEAAGIPIEGAVTDVVELTAKNYGMNSDEQNGMQLEELGFPVYCVDRFEQICPVIDAIREYHPGDSTEGVGAKIPILKAVEDMVEQMGDVEFREYDAVAAKYGNPFSDFDYIPAIKNSTDGG